MLSVGPICYRTSVRPSVTRVNHAAKTVEVMIMKFSLYGNPVPLVFMGPTYRRPTLRWWQNLVPSCLYFTV